MCFEDKLVCKYYPRSLMLLNNEEDNYSNYLFLKQVENFPIAFILEAHLSSSHPPVKTLQLATFVSRNSNSSLPSTQFLHIYLAKAAHVSMPIKSRSCVNAYQELCALPRSLYGPFIPIILFQ